MRIALISDAWHPQVNGIVTTVSQLYRSLAVRGHSVALLTPDRFRTWPCPGYPEVRLAFLCGGRLRKRLDAFGPDAIHLMTEGPVGFAARRYCRQRGYRHTSSFHSYFPEYLKIRAGIPLGVSYSYLRWFHRRSQCVLVSTDSLRADLADKGFSRLASWPLGVDTDLFRPRDKTFLRDPRPIFLYLGRVAVEKNVADFLRLDLPGTKYVVGDGHQRADLETAYPAVRFLGCQMGEELACTLAAADVLVFPSTTDTFGLVMLEALASGVPVAAYPVQGPVDVIRDSRVGQLDWDLQRAALAALALNPGDCRRYALQWSWEHSAERFAELLVPLECNRR